MKWSDLTSKQKILIVVAGVAFVGITKAFEDPKPAQKAEIVSRKPTQIETLATWNYGPDNKNIAILIYDWSALTEESAKEIAKDRCGGTCNNAYFYSSKEAYELHAYKRTEFGTSSKYSNDIKKLIAMENKWKKTNNNWKKVKDNLIAIVSFGEYQAYPYKNEID